jgi:anthranilate synthase component 1
VPCGSRSKDEFLERVAVAKRAIYEGDVYQLQLGIQFSCELDGTPFDFYRQIRTRNPSPYMFFMEHEGRAVFGASPEFLVRLDGSRARMRPLAGTRPRGADPPSATTRSAANCSLTKRSAPST